MLIYLHARELNNLTNDEYCTIIASLKYLYEDRFKCNQPDKYFINGRWETDERIKMRRQVNGCFSKIKQKTQRPRYNNITFSRCPCNFYDENIKTLIEFNEYYQQHKKLPNIFNNYSYFTDTCSVKMYTALSVVNNFIIEKRNEAIKEEQKKMADKVKNGR